MIQPPLTFTDVIKRKPVILPSKVEKQQVTRNNKLLRLLTLFTAELTDSKSVKIEVKNGVGSITTHLQNDEVITSIITTEANSINFNYLFMARKNSSV